MTIFHCKVILNGTIRGHYLEDVPAIAVYSVYPAEPDVGIMEPYIELEWLESTKKRMLKFVTKQMPNFMYTELVDQINDIRMGE